MELNWYGWKLVTSVKQLTWPTNIHCENHSQKEVIMKEHKKNHGNVLAINAVCHRVLKVMREALTKGSTGWTPFEGVPASVSVAELRKRETAG